MFNKISLSIFIGCLVICVFGPRVCFGETEARNTLAVTTDDPYYSPPSRLYKVFIPVKKDFGGKIETEGNAVIFTDDFCKLYRIEFLPISAEGLAELEEIGREKYIEGIFNELYMPLTIWHVIKESTIDYHEYLANIFKGAYYTEVFLPNGSSCSVSVNGGSFTKTDGRRGILTFIRGDYFYFVSVGSLGRKGFESQDKEDVRKYIKDSAISFARTIEFVENEIRVEGNESELDSSKANYYTVLRRSGLDEQDDVRINNLYYKYPQPEKLLSLLKVELSYWSGVNSFDYFKSNVIHFYATVAYNDKAVLSKIKEMQNAYSGKQSKIIGSIIAEAENFKSPEPNSPDNLECLAKEFVATGDLGVIKKILSVYNLTLGIRISSTTQQLVNTAELIMIKLINENHRGVYDIVQSEFVSSKGDKKIELGQIFESLNREKDREAKLLKRINQR